jgi:hypothetical protein
MEEVEVNIAIGFPDELTAQKNYSGFRAGIEVLNLFASRSTDLVNLMPEYFLDTTKQYAESQNLTDEQHKMFVANAFVELASVMQRALYIMAAETANALGKEQPGIEDMIDPFTIVPERIRKEDTFSILDEVNRILKEGNDVN